MLNNQYLVRSDLLWMLLDSCDGFGEGHCSPSILGKAAGFICGEQILKNERAREATNE